MVFKTGSHLIPRLHIIERAWRAAYKNEAKWEAARNTIGMGALDKAQAYKLTNNEFIAIASSFAMGIDYTDIFDMWGVAISREARNQIYALELEPAERVFFDITGNNHKKGELSDVRESPPA